MIVPTANYPTSRDYRQLWELAHTAAIVCIVDMDHGKPDTCRDIARTVHSPFGPPELVQVGSRGIGHVWAESLEAFIAGCEQCNLEWLVPPAALAQPEGDGPSAADLLSANPPNIPTSMAMQYRSAWREGVEDGWNEARAALARWAHPAAPRAPEVGEGPKLRAALQRITAHRPIMGSTGDYRQGQLDILKSVQTIATTALETPAAPPVPEVGGGLRCAGAAPAPKPTLHDEALIALDRIESGDVSYGADDFDLVRCAIATPPTPPVPEVGEVAELVAWLTMLRDNSTGIATRYDERLTRIASLLQQLSPPAPGMRREWVWSPSQMAECGGPCWEAQDPRCCDCGVLWLDVPQVRMDEGRVQRGNGNGGPTTLKPPIKPRPHGGRQLPNLFP